MFQYKKLQSVGFLIIIVFLLNSPLCWAAERIIYFDDFSGSGPLGGIAPDIRPGQETWIASTVYDANGTVSDDSPDGYTYQALLPFSPEVGKVYTLSLDVNPLDSSDMSTWFALGFTSSVAAESAEGDDQFYETGIGWILQRVTRSRSENDEIQTFLGPGQDGDQSHQSKEEGFVTLSVVLDTRASLWTIEWFRNGQSIRGPEAFEENPEINYVGFTKFWVTSGVVDNFKLTMPNPTAASMPGPADEETDVPVKTTLQWKPGIFAYQHDVYFGTDSVSVESATPTDDPTGVYMGRFDQNYYPDSGTISLEFEQRYFWRIDEVNATPDSTIYKGDLWSFTIEPEVIPIPGENITAAASSEAEGQGPENTVNGSGLIDNEFHSTDITAMWLTAMSESAHAWIQYEFDKDYKLNEMLVWNYNGQSFLAGSGLKDVTVEYSSDGENWMILNNITEFSQAPGTNDYASDIIVGFDSAVAKFVKITATSNWLAFSPQFGLSEVRFMQNPVRARKPSPDDGASDVAIDLTLGWRGGREAAEHKVYLSNDLQAVTDGTAPVFTVNSAGYGPLSLDLGSTYYWRIVEVNNAEIPSIWESDIWSFTTSGLLVVDDFESYNDIEAGQEGSNLVYNTWTDGYDNPATNGSAIGYLTGDSLETEIIHGGRQSVPVLYDNTDASISEVTVGTNDLVIGSDWTKGAPESLVLWIYGDPENSATDRMYVKVNGVKVIYDGDLTQAQWQEFSIDLASLGIDLGSVTTLTVGFERTGAVGGSGMIILDDIWLYRSVQ